MPLSALVLIVYYPVCAGGKFTVNSLSLSRHCTLHDYHLAQWDSQQTVYDQQYYQTKLIHVLNTVPDTKNDPSWLQYEMGNSSVFRSGFNNTTERFSDVAATITQRNQSFCFIVHDPEQLDAVLKTTTATRVIKITNFCKWMQISSFKHKGVANDIVNKVANHRFHDSNEVKDKSWFHLIDMDQGMQDQNFMQSQIKSLYAKLGWEDFNVDMWSQYYHKYINSHALIV